ncbi:MAG: hypothetical protein HYU28_07585 [Actinobacteria bacterium]|nr:hypothetical protein [Actinomycetota bacterium]
MRRARLAGRFAAVFAAVQLVFLAASRPAGADIPGAGIITDLIGGAAGWAFDKVAEGIAKWILGAVGFFVEGAVGFLMNSSAPNVQADWFAGSGSPFATVRNLAGVMLVGFVFVGLLQGLIQGDPGAMVRQIAGKLPVAVGGMVVTTAVVAYLLELTDAMSAAVLTSTDEQAVRFLSGFGVTVSGITAGFAAVVLGIMAVLAALLLWVELIIRSSLVYLLVAVSPLGFAALLWPAARGVLRRTVELLLAVVLSKFVIAVALSIGVAALAGAGDTGQAQGFADSASAGLGTLLTGAVLLGLAAFAPFLVLKLIPLAEAAIVAHGVSRGPLRAGQQGVSTYSSVQMARRLSGNGQGASGGGTFRFDAAQGGPGPGGPAGGGPAGGAPGPGGGAAGGAGGAAAGVAVAAATSGARAVARRATRQPDDVSERRGPERIEPPPPRKAGDAKEGS